MFAYRVVYQKHGCEEGAEAVILFCVQLKKTISRDVRVIIAGVQCAMFVKTYGKKMASDSE